MCVVLGVGVISVFDAVAFLACMHRVSSTVKNKALLFLQGFGVEEVLSAAELVFKCANIEGGNDGGWSSEGFIP